MQKRRPFFSSMSLSLSFIFTAQTEFLTAYKPDVLYLNQLCNKAAAAFLTPQAEKNVSGILIRSAFWCIIKMYSRLLSAV